MSDDELDEHLTGIIKTLNTAEWRDARNRLRQAIDMAVRAEREACAKVVDCFHRPCNGGENCKVRARLAAAIRNRSDNP